MIPYIIAFISCLYFLPELWQSMAIGLVALVFAPRDKKTRMAAALVFGVLIFYAFGFADTNSGTYFANARGHADEINNSVSSTYVGGDKACMIGFAYRQSGNHFDFYPTKKNGSAFDKAYLVYSRENLAGIDGKLIRIADMQLAEQKTYNVNGFNFASYVRSKAYAAAFYAKGIESLEHKHNSVNLSRYSEDHFFRTIPHAIRTYMKQKEKLLSDEAREIYSALILGNLSKDSKLAELSSTQGIIHIFVVSGFHFSILFSSMLKLLKKLRLPSYKLAYAFALLVAGLYFLVLGGGFGASRAYASILIGAICFYACKRYDAESSLYLISTFWLLAYPDALGQTGFQLSFVSTYIVVIAGKSKFISSIKSNLAASFVLALVTSFCISFFIMASGNDVPVFSFLIIVLSAILISFMLPILFIFSLIPMYFGAVLQVFASLINAVSGLYLRFLSALDSLKFIRLTLHPNLVYLGLCSVLLFIIARRLIADKWAYRRVVSFSIMLVVVVAIPMMTSPDILLVSYDLKDGEAYLIKTGEHSIVYDVGNDEQLIDLLKADGIQCIDALVISHADQDHYGLFDEVYANFDVKNVIVDDDVKCVELGDVRLKLFRANVEDASRNDISLICTVEGYGTEILLNGDIQAVGMRELIAHGLEQVDIVKAPHHGSYCEGLDVFLKLTKPRLALISGGRGKPIDKAPSYRELKNQDIEFYDTMVQGELRLRFEKGRWEIDCAR